MLDVDHVHIVDVQKISCAPVGGKIVLFDLKTHAGRIVVPIVGIIHGGGKHLGFGELCGKGLAEIRSERRDPALTREIIPNYRNTLDA